MTTISPATLRWQLNVSVGEACDLYHLQRSVVDGIPLVNILASRPLLVGEKNRKERLASD